ncbi:MAG: flagellar motor stator protein MotA [Armatimonadetes bacterium]|nr:flagellar motor stator protein MotA [Armatimonadota bacterium]
MFVFIGIFISFAAILVGYTMHGGQIGVLIQINELVILAGCGAGSIISAQGMAGFTMVIKSVIGLLKPDPITKQAYLDVLKMMYELFNIARKEGLLGMERHIEKPEESEIIQNYPSFLTNHHARDFFCDTMKVVLTGAVSPHDLAEMMEVDLDIGHHEAKIPFEAVQTVGDAMPGFGIVAAVLGVIITMGKIGGEASEVGHSVAAALVGTFLGILLAYGVFAPMAKFMEARANNEFQFMNCIRSALFSFARGESPITCVEFARRNIEPHVRPGFVEVEAAVKGQAA